MFNAFIIVWRESLEALLVIGVLMAWISRQPEQGRLRRGLWLGVVAGLGLASALGYATFVVQSQFAGEALEIFQLGMVLLASLLILQMVLWMYRHGRSMKQQIEEQARQSSGGFGVAAIAALAVAREGAETVVFLYGLTLEAAGGELVSMLIGALAGFLLAIGMGWIIVRGARFFNLRILFIFSGILLLCIAHALLANGIDRMIGMDWLAPWLDPAWDISGLLDDRHGLGRFLADFVGYRARPAGTLLLVSLVFWVYVIWRIARMMPKERLIGSEK